MTAEQIMADARRKRMGFLTEDDVRVMAEDPATRLTAVLVRCGRCRFVCAAQDAAHLIALVENSADDYVRDVSLPAGKGGLN